MGLEKNNINISWDTKNEFNVKVWRIITNVLSKILWYISLRNINVKWLGNIPTDWNFLLVSNHPSYIDLKILDDIFKDIWIKLPFICHGNFLKLPFIWNFLKSEWYLWVYNHRSTKYYTAKWNWEEESNKKQIKRIKDSKINLSSIKNSVNTILGWNNLAIFITWWWYKDKSSKIQKWYELISSKTIKKQWDIRILPVKITFVWWYKNKWLVLWSSIEVDFLKSFEVYKNNKENVFMKIEDIYKK
jgi:hypothetical protein